MWISLKRDMALSRRRDKVAAMTKIDRRKFLGLAAASAAFPAIARAYQIDARVKTGTIKDVEHVVILMQENRSFDHYFGTMNGVRGFGDRFPIPLAGGRTVWSQSNTKDGPKLIAPFPLNTQQTFAHMRVEGTPHNWADAQFAWDGGRMSQWPTFKGAHAMGHYEQADIPFQWALANAFTICDAYHCSFQGGTNTNRLFLWSGTNDGAGKLGGPSISNSHDSLPGEKHPAAATPYRWTTYPERLEKAGVSWRIYEDMANNFGDNPLVGFKPFRDSLAKAPGSNPALTEKGLSTQHLDRLRADVMAGALPSVSWVISPDVDSEHPGPSSPAQGADYTARVLDCLTSNPEVWAKTVFLVMYDENDGFFDHAPPPAPPTRDAAGKLLGGSTVDTAGEYHLVRADSEKTAEKDELMGRPYGLGPRVPMVVISPWSRGGWVNGQVFDHTSVIRFLEERFGVKETNITPWRRAVCGDLTSCFDFKTPNAPVVAMPETKTVAAKAAALKGRTKPPTPESIVAPVQATGARASRVLPYDLAVDDLGGEGALKLSFVNMGRAGAVFHVYDVLAPEAGPRRYTVEGGKILAGEWPAGAYDLCVYGPNGFFRRFAGSGKGARPRVRVRGEKLKPSLVMAVTSFATTKDRITTTASAYRDKQYDWSSALAAKAVVSAAWAPASHGWYDVTARREGDAKWLVQFAGRVEGLGATSDPALGGPAVMSWT
jgi:phospholipase C